MSDTPQPRPLVCAFCSRVVADPATPRCCPDGRLFRYYYIGGRRNNPWNGVENTHTKSVDLPLTPSR